MRQGRHTARAVDQLDCFGDGISARLGSRQPQESHTRARRRTAEHAVLEHPEYERRAPGVAVSVAIEVSALQLAADRVDLVQHVIDVLGHLVPGALQRLAEWR